MTLTMAIAPIVFILVEAIKKTEKVSKAWLPTVAVLIGFVIGIIFAIFEPLNNVTHLLNGIMYGAAAAGLYDVMKSAKNLPPM